jgi:DNA-directed RNA polymerase subunit RPC12/RpoP
MGAQVAPLARTRAGESGIGALRDADSAKEDELRFTEGIACAQCGRRFSIETLKAVDLGEEPSLRDRLIRGAINCALCPHCGSRTPIDFCFLVDDPLAAFTLTGL